VGEILEIRHWSLEDENIRLKEKINQLIDMIEELQRGDVGGNSQMDIMDILKIVIQEIEEKQLVIPYKKNSKNAKDFLKVTENDFDGILARSQIVKLGKKYKEIYEFLVATGIIKIQANGKRTWSDSKDGESIKVLLIRKRSYNYFLNL